MNDPLEEAYQHYSNEALLAILQHPDQYSLPEIATAREALAARGFTPEDPLPPAAKWPHRLLLVLQAGFVLYCFNYLVQAEAMPVNKMIGNVVLLLISAGVFMLLLRRKKLGWIGMLACVSWQFLGKLHYLLFSYAAMPRETRTATIILFVLTLSWMVLLCLPPIRRLFGITRLTFIFTLLAGFLLYFLLQVLPVLMFTR